MKKPIVWILISITILFVLLLLQVMAPFTYIEILGIIVFAVIGGSMLGALLSIVHHALTK